VQSAENKDEKHIALCVLIFALIQALEREAPTKPMIPGFVEKREYNYERHGTTCLFGNLNVATGEIVAPMLNETRTELDFLENIENVIETDPDGGWIFVCDNLQYCFFGAHMSASLVLMVALMCDIPLNTLGKKQSCFDGVPAAWHIKIDGKSPGIFGRPVASDTVCPRQNILHAETLLVAEPD